jgi:hypothetical protein
MTADMLSHALGACVIALPAILLARLAFALLLSRPLSEKATARWTSTCVTCALLEQLHVGHSYY